MRTDEELIAEHNMKIIASALLDTINAICNIEGCDDSTKYLLTKYCDHLKDIADNGNSIWCNWVYFYY